MKYGDIRPSVIADHAAAVTEQWMAKMEHLASSQNPYRVKSARPVLRCGKVGQIDGFRFIMSTDIPKRQPWYRRLLTLWLNAFDKGYDPEQWNR